MTTTMWTRFRGLCYIFAVAVIWIAASYLVQSVEEEGVSPFLFTYICNAWFVIYIPLYEIGRYMEDKYGGLLFWRWRYREESRELEQDVLLHEMDAGAEDDDVRTLPDPVDSQLDARGRWTRTRVARVSLLISPVWFFAQLAFNVSLTYTTVTSNTIISTTSSLFTFLASLAFLGEKFSWVRFIGVLFCILGAIAVSVSDSEIRHDHVAPHPVLGNMLSLLSAALYAMYITLIRKKLPDDAADSGRVSTAQLLGYLGLFNIVLFLPVALILHFTDLDRFTTLTWRQFGLISAKGLLDNVLSDYLWAKAVFLTSTTVATAGLMIQVPLAAIVGSLRGNPSRLMKYLGAAAVVVGFICLNIPPDLFNRPEQPESDEPGSEVEMNAMDSSATE